MLMVTLFLKEESIDRKVLPIDIYSATMALGLFDLEQFCKIWLMPCLGIKERKNGSLRLQIKEKLLVDLITKFESKSKEDFAFTMI